MYPCHTEDGLLYWWYYSWWFPWCWYGRGDQARSKNWKWPVEISDKPRCSLTCRSSAIWFWKQWAADRTHLSLIRDPPHPINEAHLPWVLILLCFRPPYYPLQLDPTQSQPTLTISGTWGCKGRAQRQASWLRFAFSIEEARDRSLVTERRTNAIIYKTLLR